MSNKALIERLRKGVAQPKEMAACASGQTPRTKYIKVPVQLEAAAALEAMETVGKETLNFRYKNWRGETADRCVSNPSLFFGSTEWHPKEQWLLKAFDIDKAEWRVFAFDDIYHQSTEFITSELCAALDTVDVWQDEAKALKKDCIDIAKIAFDAGCHDEIRKRWPDLLGDWDNPTPPEEG